MNKIDSLEKGYGDFEAKSIPGTTMDKEKEVERKKKTNKRGKIIAAVVAVVASLAIVIGLYVGLTANKNKQNQAQSPTGGNGTASQTPIPSENVTTSRPDLFGGSFFKSSQDRAFQVEIPLFNERVLQGYDTTDRDNMIQELRFDLTQIAKFIVNDIIDSNIRYYYPSSSFPIVEPVAIAEVADSSSVAVPAPVPAPLPAPVPAQLAQSTAEDAAFASGASSSGGLSAEGVSDFETNNQEEDVDEADLVKSDGTYNYVGYGDVLVVWEAATGKLVLNVTLTPIENVTTTTTLDPSSNTTSTTENSTITSSPDFGQGGASVTAARSFVGPWPYKPKPRIRSLLLESNKLVVIVDGYGTELRRQNIEQQQSSSSGEGEEEIAAFYNHAMETRVLIYDTSRLAEEGNLPLVHQRDIDGNFRDARAIGSVIHLVTTSNLNTYSSFSGIDRYSTQFRGLSDQEYKEAAIAIAEEESIPNFVNTVIRDLMNDEGDFPNMSRISLWQSTATNATEAIFRQLPLGAFTQLISFDVDTLNDDNDVDLEFSRAGAFTPSSWGYTYAVGDMLVFAMQGWNWIPEFRGTGETTYLLGFALNGTSATPAAVGSLPGSIINQYSLDIHDGHLRVATTIQSVWPEARNSGDGSWWARRMTKNQILILKIPTRNDDNNISGGVLEEVGRVPDLGLPNEVFTSVRFFDNVAYAVTFERTDPLFVLDVNPSNPRVLGELKISGFSSYLHPINQNKTLLLAVGQEADESTGRILGLQVTVFDARDPTNPTALFRHVIEQDQNVGSSSAAEWDFKAFRFVNLGPRSDEEGILILPLRINSWRNRSLNFDGFRVFDVSALNGIQKRLDVSHVDNDGEGFYGCYYSAVLPQRSFVFDGNLTTLKGHSVVSTDLDTGDRRWILEMPKPDNKDECVDWW